MLALVALVACGGGSSKKVTPPPPPVEPTFTWTAKGGAGLAGNGGNGSYFDFESYTGGDVKILKSGAVNTDVTLPTTLPYLGTNWVDVTADTTLEIGASGFRLSDGSDAVSNDTGAVTGIRVRPDVTLTIKPNDPSGGGPRSGARLSLSDGVIVEGTIKLAPRDSAADGDGLGPDTADFYLSSGGLFITATGKIDLSGATNASGAGANGGYCELYPDALLSAGEITTSGGAGSTNGGNGGGVYLYTSYGYAVSTGAIRADGGAGATGTGGSASDLDFETGDYGYLVAKGTLSAIGGDGGAGGGNGAEVYVYTYYGQAILSGTFVSSGGNATVDGNGGDGGDFYVYTCGPMRIGGTIDTHGGNGAGTGNGGNGDYVYLYASYDYSDGYGDYEADDEDITVGANIDTSGGAGASGGSADYIYAYGEGSDYQSTLLHPSALTFVGVTNFDGSGGNGTVDGGFGAGGSWSYLDSWYGYDGNSDYIVGNVVNEAALVLRGGNGGTGAGGGGGYLDMETYDDIYPPYNYGTKNSGAVDTSGGNGATAGGQAGGIYMYGKFYLENTGDLTANSGNGGTGNGGDYADVELYSEGPITSSAAITGNGGGSTSGSASTGASVWISTSDVCTATGAITVPGGSSTSGAGADGGYIWILGQDAPSTVGAFSAPAGTGTGSPVAGEIWVDGMQIAGP